MQNTFNEIDGSGNNARDFIPKEEEDVSFTNVLSLHLLAGGDINNKLNEIEGQVCLYERGVGGNTTNPILAFLRFWFGPIERIKRSMKKRLEQVYEQDDELYLLGFSRGSASAREFAVWLYEDGLTTKDGQKIEKVPIKFLGCFDTVSMQVTENFFTIISYFFRNDIPPSTVLNEKGKIAPNVMKAVHLVSLDDRRKPFSPVMMGAEEKVHEVWFAGVHCDIGGSYFKKGMSDYACKYMLEWMKEYGLKFMKAEQLNEACLKIDGYDLEVKKEDLKIEPDCNFIHYNEGEWSRQILVAEDDKEIEGATVNIHESVLLHMEAKLNQPDKYIINPKLKNCNVRVVGSLGKVLEDETKRLNALLQSDY